MTLFSTDLLFDMRKINANAKNQAFGFANKIYLMKRMWNIYGKMQVL
jgi:hypothetical protein